MRKLAQALLITFACFSVAGVYAAGPEEESSEVAVSTEGDETNSQNRLFQQEEQSEDDDKPKA